jgi:methanogenic corrinoid protein MtbC1
MLDFRLIKEEFYNALVFIDKLKAKEILNNFVTDNQLMPFIEKVAAETLIRIGEEWEEGLISLSQVYMAGKICEEVVEEVLPSASPKRKRQPKAAIVMLEDHHVLGKRIVYTVLRSSGFELEDWGAGLRIDEIISKVINSKIEVLLVSTLMLNSALHTRDLIIKLKKKNPDLKVIVGGAPFIFDKNLWKEVNAYAMGENASDAVKLFNDLTGKDRLSIN